MVLACQGYAWEAEHWFKKAIAVRPDFRGALFNLALLLTEEQRSLEAVPYLETLLIHHPHHIKVSVSCICWLPFNFICLQFT
jgi:hypothetical protein